MQKRKVSKGRHKTLVFLVSYITFHYSEGTSCIDWWKRWKTRWLIDWRSWCQLVHPLRRPINARSDLHRLDIEKFLVLVYLKYSKSHAYTRIGASFLGAGHSILDNSTRFNCLVKISETKMVLILATTQGIIKTTVNRSFDIKKTFL